MCMFVPLPPRIDWQTGHTGQSGCPGGGPCSLVDCTTSSSVKHTHSITA